MTRTSIAAIVGVLSMLSVAPAFAVDSPTADQCTAWFAKSDTNSDGALGKGENVAVIEAMNKTSTTVMEEDAIIKKEAFLDACGKGTLGMPAM
jgi:hypothetical protein